MAIINRTRKPKVDKQADKQADVEQVDVAQVSEPEPIKQAAEVVVKPKRVRKPKVDQQTEPVGTDVGVVVKTKRTLPPALRERSTYFKENYDSVRHLPNSERIKALSDKFKASKI